MSSSASTSSAGPKIYRSPFPDCELSPLSLIPFLESHQPGPNIKAYEDFATGRYYTREQVFSRARRLGAGLRRSKPHLKKGDVVLVFGRNSIDYPVVLLGAVAAGLVPTLASSAFGPTELAYQIQDSKAALAFVDPDLLPILQQAYKLLKGDVRSRLEVDGKQPHTVLIQGGGKSTYDSLMTDKPEKEVYFAPEEVAETTALICYSSGTTGNPKGVMTTHKNLTTAVLTCGAQIRPFSPGKDWTVGYLPWYHMYGGLFVMFMSLFDGFSVVAMPKFTVDAFCAATEKYKVRFGFCVPPTLMTLAKSPEVKKYDMKSLKWLMSAAAPCKEELTRAVEAALPGFSVCQFYGATETSPTATCLLPEDARKYRGTVGKFSPNVQARIVHDDGTDVDVSKGEEGELWIKGPFVMKGYLGKPEATRDAITPEGFYKTGDIVRLEGDVVRIVDRKKELIKYKSLQVAPAELEGVLIAHPDIADVGVIGVWSEKQQTELPRAYIVPAKGVEAFPTPESRAAFATKIHEWFNPQVAHYKRLIGGIVLIETMPRLLSGKIKRRDLRELAKLDFVDEDYKPKAKL